MLYNYCMNRYYATFASGFQEVVEEILQKDFPQSKVIKLLDGAVIFECPNFPKLNFANNLFSVINTTNEKVGLNKFIGKLLLTRLDFNVKTKSEKTFRIVTSKQNQLVAVDNGLKLRLEQIISKQTGLKLNRLGADIEFWLLERSEGITLFLERLTKHKDYEKILNKGELHPPIAYILNYLSEPKKDEFYLDPFCGGGMLPLVRMQNFASAQVFANDISESAIGQLKQKQQKDNKLSEMKISNEDFFKYNFNGMVFDKIVTDPPWGKFDTDINIEEFYKEYFIKTEKLLKKNGILVLLTARDIDIIKFANGFKVLTKLDVLISGKKANVYKMIKL